MGKGRFAPSPSGRMHLGNVCSALVSWLSARSADDAFSLRLEDLDDRCRSAENARLIVDDLAWLGFDWDEQLTQTARISAYQSAFETLCARDHVYPCFCSRADLHAASAPHASDGTPLYAGACRNLTPEQVTQKSRVRRPAYRIEVPDKTVEFTDGHLGLVRQNLAAECGDFVLRRSDGVFAYQLVCVVDDALTGCTQVVRGDDLLSSTPRQLFLYEELGYEAPQFFHHPMLLSPDGRRLSKRDRDLDLGELRARHVAPEWLVGKLAFMLGIIEQSEPCRPKELIREFSWAKLPSHDLVVDGSEFLA
jgi:glutamyl-tRNA synthetase